MRRLSVLLLLALAACSDGNPAAPRPPLEVALLVESGASRYGGCWLTWAVITNDSTVAVQYDVGVSGAASYRGALFGSGGRSWLLPIAVGDTVAVRWQMTAGEFASADTIPHACGSRWETQL